MEAPLINPGDLGNHRPERAAQCRAPPVTKMSKTETMKSFRCTQSGLHRKQQSWLCEALVQQGPHLQLQRKLMGGHSDQGGMDYGFM